MVRFLLVILLIFYLGHNGMAQYDPNYQYQWEDKKTELYAKKVRSYTKMQNFGLGMGVGGGLLTIAGIVMISNAEWETTTYNGTTNTTTSDSDGIAGLVFVCAGVPLTITGTVLGIIGGAKKRSYEKKLEGLSVNLKYGKDQQGFVLTYKF